MQTDRDPYLDIVNAFAADMPPDPAWDDQCVSIYAEVITMRWLASELAAHHGVDHHRALASIDSMGPNLAPLLRSRQGMMVLGSVVGGDLVSSVAAPFIPTLH